MLFLCHLFLVLCSLFSPHLYIDSRAILQNVVQPTYFSLCMFQLAFNFLKSYQFNCLNQYQEPGGPEQDQVLYNYKKETVKPMNHNLAPTDADVKGGKIAPVVPCKFGAFLSALAIIHSLPMDAVDVFYNKDEYVETASGNRVSRQTVLCGSQNIVLSGKVIVQTGAIIRGDLANVRVGRFCIISKGAVIRPLYKQFSKGVAFFPLHIGDHVFIGENSIVSASSVGSYVHIGKDVVIGRRCVLKDCCIIEDGAILPPETTVASFMKFTKRGTIEGGQGNPNYVPPGMQDLMVEYTKSYYEHFIPITN